jgi:hypothetical protein
MKAPFALLLGLGLSLTVCSMGLGQQFEPDAQFIEGPPSCSSNGGPHGLHWTHACFPRCGCPDDYCPHPYPPPCPSPYPPFYLCGPAGDCGHAPVGSHARDRLSWWFVPTPRALADAIWCRP